MRVKRTHAEEEANNTCESPHDTDHQAAGNKRFAWTHDEVPAPPCTALATEQQQLESKKQPEEEKAEAEPATTQSTAPEDKPKGEATQQKETVDDAPQPIDDKTILESITDKAKTQLDSIKTTAEAKASVAVETTVETIRSTGAAAVVGAEHALEATQEGLKQAATKAVAATGAGLQAVGDKVKTLGARIEDTVVAPSPSSSS